MSSNKKAEKDHIKSSEKSQSFYQLEKANSHLPQNGSPVKVLLILATGFDIGYQQAWGCSKREDKPRDDDTSTGRGSALTSEMPTILLREQER